VQVEGALRFDDFSDAWRVVAKQLQSLEAVRERLARALILTWPPSADPGTLLARLEAVLRGSRGGQCAVIVRYRGREASGSLSCGEAWNVRPSGELLEQLEELLGAGAVRIGYGVAESSAALAR